MKIALAADHAGFSLKEEMAARLEAAGHEVLDLGAASEAPVDYPDVAKELCLALVRGDAQRGVLVCGSGIGACIAANKIKSIRAGVAHDAYSARQGVEHDRMNVLCLGSRVVGVELAWELVRAFVGASFTGEDRHRRRLDKVRALEEKG